LILMSPLLILASGYGQSSHSASQILTLLVREQV
jgi:hypothetical protein